MTLEERVEALESKFEKLSDLTVNALQDVAQKAADKQDVEALQIAVSDLAAQVTAVSADLQAVRDLAKE